ncbi:MFS general substrate transporter [Aulographum hederae CBS 113979]|uniref:MFS general substrate transporter n=1 Tax=Aulographum hederae CBS 113979 TaxID=1176131 RepID=A0A6G1H9G4_9PEZI|nr:MFS general substrate transporter [Aulographum hederae CBS 113979]
MAADISNIAPYNWKYLTWDTDLEIEAGNNRKHSKLPRNPLEWSPTYKTYLAVLGCIANFSTTYAGGGYTSGTSQMSDYFGVSQVAVLVGVTLYTVGFALTPMVLAPLSELTGRRPIFLVSGVFFAIAAVCVGVTRIYTGLLLARLFLGCANSVFAVIIVGVVADIYSGDEEKNAALALFTGGAMFGNGFGPLVSGFTAQQLGWRWISYILAVFVAVMVAVFAVSFGETRSDVLLRRKAHMLNTEYEEKESTQNSDVRDEHQTYPTRWYAQERQSAPQIIRISLTRPMLLLFTEPIVFCFSLWAAFSWSVTYAFLIVIPYTFQVTYDMSLQDSSAIFAAMCIAAVLMTILSYSHYRLARLCGFDTLANPEVRLYFPAVESTLVPIGLFWFGWTIRPDVPWIVPALAVGCTTMGMFSVYLAVFAYLAAAYPKEAASANAAQSMVRNLMAGGFPLFSRAMFETLGFGPACSLLGGIGILLTFVPWVLIWAGPKIRAMSKRAFGNAGD